MAAFGGISVQVRGQTVASIAATGKMEVFALPSSECNQVRQALEDGVPIGPGFRKMEFEFPPNAMGITGRLCRLMTMGSGAHIEGQNIRALADMHAFVRGTLEQHGWRETQDTKPFRDRSRSGRDVFALFKNNAICVSTIEIGMVPGYVPGTSAKENKRIHLGALYPYERDWWLTVDCFHL